MYARARISVTDTIMDYKILNFVIFCVGSVADALKMSAKDVYHRMSKGGIISDYLLSRQA